MLRQAHRSAGWKFHREEGQEQKLASRVSPRKQDPRAFNLAVPVSLWSLESPKSPAPLQGRFQGLSCPRPVLPRGCVRLAAPVAGYSARKREGRVGAGSGSVGDGLGSEPLFCPPAVSSCCCWRYSGKADCPVLVSSQSAGFPTCASPVWGDSDWKLRAFFSEVFWSAALPSL